MKYIAVITIKKDDKEDHIYMKFDKGNIFGVLQAFEALLNHAEGDEVTVFARRYIK